MIQHTPLRNTSWLIFFYSVPSKPVNVRVRAWRKLAKIGAVQLKDTVYILPHNEEHYEFFQWLASETASSGGDSAFIKVEKIETMKQDELIDLFNRQREKDYRHVKQGLEEIERKVGSAKKGSKGRDIKGLADQFAKHFKEYEEIRRKDFFMSKAGAALEKRLAAIDAQIKSLSAASEELPSAPIEVRRIEDYQCRIWATRKNPFVDRMASAWLIRRFIDKRATFVFMDEDELESAAGDVIVFDVRGGEFTHHIDMCTFEVLIKAFGIKDKAVRDIAEIVHEIDTKDDMYQRPEARGVEEILMGIRRTARSDAEALEQGMVVFEMLYSSKAWSV